MEYWACSTLFETKKNSLYYVILLIIYTVAHREVIIYIIGYTQQRRINHQEEIALMEKVTQMGKKLGLTVVVKNLSIVAADHEELQAQEEKKNAD